MSNENLNPIEIDAIGEIINISLGASATAVATMLDRRVDITTPNVKVVTFEEFEFRQNTQGSSADTWITAPC